MDNRLLLRMQEKKIEQLLLLCDTEHRFCPSHEAAYERFRLFCYYYPLMTGQEDAEDLVAFLRDEIGYRGEICDACAPLIWEMAHSGESVIAAPVAYPSSSPAFGGAVDWRAPSLESLLQSAVEAMEKLWEGDASLLPSAPISADLSTARFCRSDRYHAIEAWKRLRLDKGQEGDESMMLFGALYAVCQALSVEGLPLLLWIENQVDTACALLSYLEKRDCLPEVYLGLGGAWREKDLRRLQLHLGAHSQKKRAVFVHPTIRREDAILRAQAARYFPVGTVCEPLGLPAPSLR